MFKIKCMKKIILFSLFLLSVSITHGQISFSIEVAEDSIVKDLADQMDYTDIKAAGFFKNTSTGRNSYVWKREITFISPLIASAVCDPKACYEPPANEPPVPFLLEPDSTGSWDMHLYAYDYYETPFPLGKPLAGYVDLRITAYNFSNPNDSLKLDYHLEVKDATSSREEIEVSPFRAFPNPTSNYLNVAPAQSVKQIELFSLNGQQLATFDIIRSTGNINLSGFQSGMYVLKIHNRNNKVSFMKIMKE